MNVEPETMFALADDLMKAQSVMINTQNELIKRLMDRIEALEAKSTRSPKPSDGLKGLQT